MAYNSRLQRNGGHQGLFKFDNNATATPIGGVGTQYKVSGNTTSLYLQNFTHTNNRLTYVNPTGINTTFSFVFIGSFFAANNNQDIRVTINKNGTVLLDFKIGHRLRTANVVECISTQGIVTLTNGDYVEIIIVNQTSTSNITLQNGTLYINETL